MSPGSSSPFLELAVGSNCIDSSVALANLLLQGRSGKCHHCFNQALLDWGYIICQVQGGLYVLGELKPRELQLDLIDQVLQILLLLKLLKKRGYLSWPFTDDLAAEDLVFGLFRRCVLRATLPIISLCNEPADAGVLVDR
jgi:hypothetical protein